jgi:hypothetical protein
MNLFPNSRSYVKSQRSTWRYLEVAVWEMAREWGWSPRGNSALINEVLKSPPPPHRVKLHLNTLRTRTGPSSDTETAGASVLGSQPQNCDAWISALSHRLCYFLVAARSPNTNTNVSAGSWGLVWELWLQKIFCLDCDSGNRLNLSKFKICIFLC